MLIQLKIENIALIEIIEINFEKGLNIITGDSGSGKSLILDSLNVLFGGTNIPLKHLIRPGKDFCVIEAVFSSSSQINNWLIKSFRELGLNLQYGNLRNSSIQTNCFGTSLISDLVDQDGFKRIGSAQFRKKGAFLQHGEIQTNPSRDLWLKLFKEEAPPKINLKLTNDEIVQHLRNSFQENKSNINFKNIAIDNKK